MPRANLRLRNLGRVWSRSAAVVMTGVLSACACTAVGCHNIIRVTASTDLRTGVAYRAQACFDEACEDVVLQATPTRFGLGGHLVLDADQDVVDYELGEGDFGGTHEFRLQLDDPDGGRIIEVDHEGSLERYEPNGGWPCGPTCWRLSLTIADASGA